MTLSPYSFFHPSRKLLLKSTSNETRSTSGDKASGSDSGEGMPGLVGDWIPRTSRGKTEVPVKTEALVRMETLARVEASVKRETPARAEASVRMEVLARAEASVRKEVLARAEASVRREILARAETSVKTETPARAEMAGRQSHYYDRPRYQLLAPQKSLDERLRILMEKASLSMGDACLVFLEQMLELIKRNPILVNHVPKNFTHRPLELTLQLGKIEIAKELVSMKAAVRPQYHRLYREMEHLLSPRHMQELQRQNRM